MAKGIGLIGNFRGKVGNMVGYNLKDSNNKQTQGVRVYQPVVKNPKTYGQAEQRAKLAPINATYRALKAIIDRGQEGKAYGNKSRLAWLSDAMKAFKGAWYEKNAAMYDLSLVTLTKGSLPNLFPQESGYAVPQIALAGATAGTIATIGALSTALIAAYPRLKDGDQLTYVLGTADDNGIVVYFDSLVIDTTSTAALPSFVLINEGVVMFGPEDVEANSGCIIISREGDGGQHLRSTTPLYQMLNYGAESLADAAKEAAIKSYMAAGANTDWAEESLQ